MACPVYTVQRERCRRIARETPALENREIDRGDLDRTFALLTGDLRGSHMRLIARNTGNSVADFMCVSYQLSVVPLSETACGLPAASLPISRVAVWVPGLVVK